MAWLSDWAKRIELTIDDTNVDSDLTNFPVLVYLSAASGIGDVDASAVFDELTSDANRKKIAVTTDDGETQCYVEIERWDDANEVAWLWVKVPSILASGGATLYLYYDSSKADNTTYIGDITDAAGQAVWDSNFVFVCHMAQDPNGDGANAIKDSTSNANHLTPTGSMTSDDLVDAVIGKGIDFDGSNDTLAESSISITGAFACEWFIEPDTTTDYNQQFGAVNSWGAFWCHTAAAGGLYIGTDITKRIDPTDTGNNFYVDNAQHWCAFVYDGTNGSLYKAGALAVGPTAMDTPGAWGGFRISGATYKVDGVVDEVRISNVDRGAAWIKATYYSSTDTLITFGTEETQGDTTVVTLTQPFSVTCNLNATLKIGIPLTSALSVQTNMSAEIGWKVFAEPLSVNFSMSIGNIVCIWKELLDRDSRITTVLEENSPITKTLERDSLISDLTENSILGT